MSDLVFNLSGKVAMVSIVKKKMVEALFMDERRKRAHITFAISSPFQRGFKPAGSNRVTDCINKGRWSLFSKGGEGSGHVLAQKILKFQSPKMRFSASWGMNLSTKERVFHSRKYGFQFISHNQFLKAMNNWWKLNYVILHVNKFCETFKETCEEMTEI